MRGPVFKWIKIIIIVYCAIGIAFYYLQDQLLFHPEKKAKNEAYNFNIPYKEVNIAYDTASNLNIIQFTPKDDTVAKGVVLYFHGNKKNIGWYAKYAPNFTKNGYEVWMIDYPGFGKSTGKLTEQRLYDYALQLYKLARTKYGKDSIIIYGKSMGTGVAAQLASIRDCKRLILETPYSSMRGLVQTYFFMYPIKNMLHYNLPTYEYLQKVIDPVTIFHGTDDRLITYRNAAKLKPFLKPGDEFVTIKGGAHNNLNDYKLFHEKLDSLLR
jgi:alpha-beta hydrolase superfamily lysophospholipase